MKRIVTAAALLALAVPALAAADDPNGPSAEQLCRAQRTAIGADAFKALYGTNANKSNAFGKCVSKANKTKARNRSNAVSACRAEQADANFASTHGGKTFAQFYGTGKNGNNAFGKCVSGKAKAANAASQRSIINAAKACKTERAADPAAFKAKYGTNANKSNAFGKCVSAKAKAKNG